MKVYGKSQLAERAKAYFGKYPTVKTVYATSDGYLFLTKNRAENWAGKTQTVYEFENEGHPTIDVLSLNVAEATALIKSLENIEELQKQLAVEVAQAQPRKTVVTLLEKRIVELQDA